MTGLTVSSYISYYKHVLCCFCYLRVKHCFYRNDFQGNSEKSVSILDSSIDSSSCRLCRAVGDTSHHKNIFKPTNRALLKIAEQICGHPIVYDANLPHLICRPCERRLNNAMAFQKVIVETEQFFRQRESTQTRFKRCVGVSPSASQPPRSRRHTFAVGSSVKPAARTSLSFDSCQESGQNIKVSMHYL